jgi:hypothetical protein
MLPISAAGDGRMIPKTAPACHARADTIPRRTFVNVIIAFSLSESSVIKDLRGPPRAFFLLPPRFAHMASRALGPPLRRGLPGFHVCLV